MKKLFLLLLILLSYNVFACDCMEKPSIKKNWNEATDVFTAKIIDVDSSHYSINGNRIYLSNVKIIHSYKNKLYNGFEMRTFYFTEDRSCDFIFLPGKEYLIYTSQQTGIISNATICSRTSLLSNVDASELKELKSLYDNRKDHNTPSNEMTFVVNKKEYENLQNLTQENKNLTRQLKKSKEQSGFFLIISIVFIVLYIKTKKKLKSTKNL